MVNKGREIDTYRTVKQVLDDRENDSDNRHYFYIIQLPACGSDRVKIGISSNIKTRFWSYQNVCYGSVIRLLRLRQFPNQRQTRYGESGLKLYEVFEREVKKLLRDFNKDKNKDGSGVITEWFDKEYKGQLLKMFDRFVDNEFESLEIEKTPQKTGLRTLKEIDYTEKSETDIPVKIDLKERNSYIGKVLYKSFPGYKGKFRGVVSKYIKSRDVYDIRYDDGDDEEMVYQEMKRYVDKSKKPTVIKIEN